jgi:SSS family solute:Na+ symporter
MSSLRWLDCLIVAAYLGGMLLIGLYFSRKQKSTEEYFVANRSIPSWAMGISLFATIISSVTFIAYPGAGYAGNWADLIPGFMVVFVLMIVGLIVIPFYRHVVGMSAYEYFGKRFGYGARAYSSFAFAVGHFSKMGFVLYLTSLPIKSLTGWGTLQIILVVGTMTTLYTLIGGIEGVIWSEVIQGLVKIAGLLVVLGCLLYITPGGPSVAFRTVQAAGKISFGSAKWDFSNKTVWVMILYGIFFYLQKYTADQTVVQRYLVAKSDRAALKGVSLGILMCVPVWSLFLLVGSLLWSFYKLTGEALPKGTKNDEVFPHFLVTHIPPGIAGLFMAALLAAAMSTLSSDMNCLSVVGVEDFYRRLKPQVSDRQRLRVGKLLVGIIGALSIVIALILAVKTETALNAYFTATSIVSGGLVGLFALAFLTTRANRQGVWIGIIASLVFTAWATLTVGGKIWNLGRLNFPLHDLMIGVVGHLILLLVGYVASLFFIGREINTRAMTIYGWLDKRKILRPELPAPENQVAHVGTTIFGKAGEG